MSKRHTVISDWSMAFGRHPTDEKQDGVTVYEHHEWDDAVGHTRPIVFQVPCAKDDAVYKTIEALVQKHNDSIPGHCVYAFGETPEKAIQAFGEHVGWGKITGIGPLAGDNGRYHWGRSFLAGGTSMKAAGVNCPGGVILTWWK